MAQRSLREADGKRLLAQLEGLGVPCSLRGKFVSITPQVFAGAAEGGHATGGGGGPAPGAGLDALPGAGARRRTRILSPTVFGGCWLCVWGVSVVRCN